MPRTTEAQKRASKKYYESHKVLKPRVKKSKEDKQARRKQYDMDHPEIRQQRVKANRDKINERMNVYRKLNPDGGSVCGHRRRAKMRGLLATFTLTQWREVKCYFHNQCAYCGDSLPLTQDHFIPVRAGGCYILGNILPACKGCNSSKRATLFAEWYPHFRYYDKQRERFILEYNSSF